MVAAPRLLLRISLRLALGLAVGPMCAASPPAAAQGWFGGFFGGGQPRGYDGAPPYPGYGRDEPYYSAPRRRAPRRKAPVEQAQEQAAKPATPPRTATVFVDVFGDSLGQLLANGLDDALADKTEVGVVHLAHGSSGLVNDTYYDWPRAIDDLLAKQGRTAPDKDRKDKAEKDASGKDAMPQGKKASPDKADQDRPPRIDVAVMMIGSNDRQAIVQDGKKLAPGSNDWNVVYRKRVQAIAEAFQKKRIPLVWVGVPIVKEDDFADDMAALNDIYREAAAKTGAAYIDTWEAFSDDNGDFSAYGPDVNGQTVRLRSADGIYFTKAGARKLAHFVETQVRRDLDGKTPLPQLPTADAPPTDAKSKGSKPALALVKLEAGPIKNLDEPPAAKDGQLAEVPAFKSEASRDAIVANALVKGQSESAPVGRADNFRWQAGGSGAQ